MVRKQLGGKKNTVIHHLKMLTGEEQGNLSFVKGPEGEIFGISINDEITD